MKKTEKPKPNQVKPKEVIEEKVEAQPIKPKLVEKKYILIRDFHIGGELRKKGTPIYLTKEGKTYLKNNFYI